MANKKLTATGNAESSILDLYLTTKQKIELTIDSLVLGATIGFSVVAGLCILWYNEIMYGVVYFIAIGYMIRDAYMFGMKKIDLFVDEAFRKRFEK